MAEPITSAKQLRLAPIESKPAHAFVRRWHYSGKTVNNSQIHLGVFAGRVLVGVLQFGPPMDKRKVLGLVSDTQWDGMVELNRMAMIDNTPRNAESRAIAVACRLLAKQYPRLEWVLSFADGTQCGDGTIYRAAGFVLTRINDNIEMFQGPNGHIINKMTATKSIHAIANKGRASMGRLKQQGYKPLPGFQLRYIKFLRPGVRQRLTVPELPYSAIQAAGARMYKGERLKDSSEPPGVQPGEGGAAPTQPLHISPKQA